MFDASHEAYEALRSHGVTVYPEGDDKFYGKGPKRSTYLILNPRKHV